jgi:hypothetical protein
MSMTRVTWLLVLGAAGLAACGSTSHTPDAGAADPDAGETAPDVPPAGRTASGRIGPAGGELVLDDLELQVPPGAVNAETEITVTVTDEPVPGSFTGFSPVYRFEPEGTVFETPVTVRLPFAGDRETATVFWTAAGGGSFVPLRTRVEGGVAVVEATHFSSAFVGTACSGEDCCSRANGDLDVLLMVDNSNSMAEEQASLTAQIPRMARIFATGDLDGDGVQDFPALRSVRIGTVSSDMGTGGYPVPTCADAELGDDGILRTQGRTDVSGCMASYPSYAELSADDPSADVEGFVSHVGCVATLGTGGCGFEQQLEAVLKATTPSTSATTFFRGTRGHADGANAGFLRSDSVFAAIALTDENDCSALDPELFDPSSETYAATSLNLRCFVHGDAVLHPVSRYVEGLRSLRSDPDDVIFGLIAGVPTDLVADPTDHEAILSDPRMMERIDPAAPRRLVPSCNVPGRGVAFPPRRLVEVAAGFGDNGVVQSICQEDFTPVVDAILQRVAARVSGSCGTP